MQRQEPEENALTLTDPRSKELRDFWDKEAATFDEDPDHGLWNPIVRAAWTNRLAAWLPAPPRDVLDIGCGTGSLSVVLTSLGYEVLGVDWSSAMVPKPVQKRRRLDLILIFG